MAAAFKTVDADGVNRGHVNLCVGEFARKIGDRSHAIVTLDQEPSFRAGHLPFGGFRHVLERGRVGRKEIKLSTPPRREPREREKVHAGVLQRPQDPGSFARFVRHQHVEVVDLANRVCHRCSSLMRPLRGAQTLPSAPRRRAGRQA